ncbi:MAG: Spy/CpxP family protein refolding chaperone [Candidatus Eisenbacteria bacterium]|nr:Spy/CpxP family protein refolding chaperone [Candidatus Eisenbacteria bacterium]
MMVARKTLSLWPILTIFVLAGSLPAFAQDAPPATPAPHAGCPMAGAASAAMKAGEPAPTTCPMAAAGCAGMGTMSEPGFGRPFLNDQQKARLDDLREEGRARQIEGRKALMRVQNDIRGEWMQEQPSMERLRAMAARVGEIETQMRIDRFEMRMRVRDILTPEQRDQMLLRGGMGDLLSGDDEDCCAGMGGGMDAGPCMGQGACSHAGMGGGACMGGNECMGAMARPGCGGGMQARMGQGAPCACCGPDGCACGCGCECGKGGPCKCDQCGGRKGACMSMAMPGCGGARMGAMAMPGCGGRMQARMGQGAPCRCCGPDGCACGCGCECAKGGPCKCDQCGGRKGACMSMAMPGCGNACMGAMARPGCGGGMQARMGQGAPCACCGPDGCACGCGCECAKGGPCKCGDGCASMGACGGMGQGACGHGGKSACQGSDMSACHGGRGEANAPWSNRGPRAMRSMGRDGGGPRMAPWDFGKRDASEFRGHRAPRGAMERRASCGEQGMPNCQGQKPACGQAPTGCE